MSLATLSARSSLSTGPSLPGQNRHARLLHDAPRARLVAHQPDDLRVGTDELDVARLADFGEVRALGQEAVAGMDGVGAGDFGGADDRRHVQVAVGAARRADADVLVGEPDVQGVLVGLGVDGDRLDAQLAAGEDDAQRDLAAVGDQDLLEHLLRANREQPFTVLHRLTVLDVDVDDFAVVLATRSRSSASSLR